jgi:hypothetical protein
MAKKRWTRFLFPGLLACVVATLLAVVLMVWVQYQREQSAIREISRMGGAVFIDPRGPNWLREWVGNERMYRFDKVVGANLNETHVTDAWLEHFKSLTNRTSEERK